jgi:hypothetical protein
MNHLKLYEDYHSDEWSDLIRRVLSSEFQPITDTLWDSIELDGYTEEVNDYKGDFDRSHYTYTEVEISNEDKQGLISMDSNTIDKWNDFDIELKDNHYPAYLDFIDYDNGKVYVVKYL